MMELQPISPLRPLQAESAGAVGETTKTQPTMFADIFRSMVDNVRQTDAAKTQSEYALATGQLDNPAVASVAATQAELSLSLLVQMRNKALDAYSELMRISL